MNTVACYRWIYILTVFLFVISACSNDDEDKEVSPVAKEEVQEDNIAYGSDPLNVLDLHLPANRSNKTKIIVFVHGGGWREGSKEQFSAITGEFVKAGYATASINYRHADAAANITYIELLDDIRKALSFLKTESREYVFNGNDVVLFGHSAGAHLALLYAYRNDEAKQVKSVVSLSAPTDLKELLESGTFPSLLYNLVGSDDLTKYEDASPTEHVSADVVRTYVMHGKVDDAVPFSQSQELYNLIVKWNSSSRIKLIDGEGHDFSEESYPLIISESIKFIQ